MGGFAPCGSILVIFTVVELAPLLAGQHHALSSVSVPQKGPNTTLNQPLRRRLRGFFSPPGASVSSSTGHGVLSGALSGGYPLVAGVLVSSVIETQRPPSERPFLFGCVLTLHRSRLMLRMVCYAHVLWPEVAYQLL